jgi:hypothetical protein
MDKVEIIERIAENDTDVVKDVVLELIMNSYNNRNDESDIVETQVEVSVDEVPEVEEVIEDNILSELDSLSEEIDAIADIDTDTEIQDDVTDSTDSVEAEEISNVSD